MSAGRIAVLGAGLTGVSTALELARQGRDVDLYDETPQPVSRASHNNEGKIHLGLVYAHDPSTRTAETMITGALHFLWCLRRWIDLRPDDLPVSTPFHYAVHEGTMVDVAALEAHYRRCAQLFAAAAASTGHAYLGVDRRLLAERSSPAETARIVSRDHCVAAFRTSERGVDPRAIAHRLREALAAASRVRFHGATAIRGVAWTDDRRLRVTCRHEGQDRAETYDHVVNALWHGRLAIDASLGLAPAREWLYRYKIGGWLPDDAAAGAVPSLTFVLGPFGDVVDFGARGVYFSWYPTGMVGSSRALEPPDWEASLGLADRRAILRRSYEAVAARCPALRARGFAEDRVDPVGGVIFAWGATDIHAPDSRLHTRHEIGIHSVGGYHSVNTGKYTMAPYLGWQAAARVLGT